MIRYAVLLTISFALTAVLVLLQPAPKSVIALGAFFNIVSVIGVYHVTSRVVAGKLFHGRKRYDELSWQLAAAFRATKLWRHLVARFRAIVLCGCVLVLTSILARPIVVLIVPMLLFAVQWLFFLVASRSVPPALLMLGSSSEPFRRAVHDFRKAFSPLRTVALLATPNDPVSAAFQVFRDFPWSGADPLDELRTTGETDWISLVGLLSTQVRVVLLDARVVTGPLLEEAAIVARTGTSERTVIVVGQEAKYPLLDELEPSTRLFFDQHARLTEPEQAFELTSAAMEERRAVEP